LNSIILHNRDRCEEADNGRSYQADQVVLEVQGVQEDQECHPLLSLRSHPEDQVVQKAQVVRPDQEVLEGLEDLVTLEDQEVLVELHSKLFQILQVDPSLLPLQVVQEALVGPVVQVVLGFHLGQLLQHLLELLEGPLDQADQLDLAVLAGISDMAAFAVGEAKVYHLCLVVLGFLDAQERLVYHHAQEVLVGLEALAGIGNSCQILVDTDQLLLELEVAHLEAALGVGMAVDHNSVELVDRYEFEYVVQ